MFFALGAASSILDGLQSLGSSKSSSSKSGNAGRFDLPDGSSSAVRTGLSSSATGPSQISPRIMSWLLAAQSDASATASSRSTSSSGAASSSGTDPLQDLFAQIDGNGDGQISRSEFEAVLGAGGTNVAKADKVFGELDGNGDGSVSPDEMKWALKAGHRPQHHHGAVASATDGANASTSAESASNADALLQAMSSATQINSDGSTTTTQTNLESSAVKTTKAAASSAVQNASAHYHLAQLQHNRQIQASTVAGSSTALSV